MIETFQSARAPKYHLSACSAQQQQSLCIHLHVSYCFLVLLYAFFAGPVGHVPKTNVPIIEAHCRDGRTDLDDAVDDALTFLWLSHLFGWLRIDHSQLLVVASCHQLSLGECQRSYRVLHDRGNTSESCLAARRASEEGVPSMRQSWPW